MIDNIIAILIKHKALTLSSVVKTQSIQFDKFPEGKYEYQNKDRHQVISSLSLSKETFTQIDNDFQELPFGVEFSQVLKQHEKLPQYSGLHNVFADQKVNLTHKPGEILLIDIWATWCGPCLNPMNHNQQMLTKNAEKWKDKVRIVAISVDQQKQIIADRVNQKGWTKMDHLTLLGWNDKDPIIKDFKIKSIPFVVLVDTQGAIAYKGNPGEVNLQQKINQILTNKSTSKKIETQKSSIEAIQKQIKQIGELTKAIDIHQLKKLFGKVEFFSFLCKIKAQVENGDLQHFSIDIDVSAFQEDQQYISQFKELLKDLEPNCYTLKQHLVKYQTCPQPQNPECIDCKQKLKYPFYWCKWDPNPNSFRCRNCVEKKPEQKGKHYSYLQNSVLLRDKWQKIPSKGFGKNTQPQNISQVSQPNQFVCNGCDVSPEEVGNPRYTCLICSVDPNYQGDYVDLCFQCANSYLDDDQDLIQTLNVNGHTSKHPFLRILYNVEGYDNY